MIYYHEVGKQMEIYILAGVRTPIGSFLGSLSRVAAPQLGACAISGTLEKSDLSAEDVDEVFMGQVLSAGQGQAPARQAALFAKVPEYVPCTTVNKVCGSGMACIILASRSLALGDNQLVLAGGMESMSQAPHFISGSRQGIRFGEGVLKDSIAWDGLRDVYTDRPMGSCAEECVERYNFSREELDSFAKESFTLAQKAQAEGVFAQEIVSVTIPGRKGKDILVDWDEGPGKANFAKMPSLRPAFISNGKITAANASTLSDGAAALLLGGSQYKARAEFKVVAYAGHAQNPTWFTTAPGEAMKKCLAKANLTSKDIDLFEINEAFAAVTIAAIKDLDLDREKVNIYGGGISLGHPIGCSGTRIVVTLMTAMKKNNARLGMASLCIGGGEGLALIIERI